MGLRSMCTRRKSEHTTAMVRVPGVILAITSLISSVWIRSPSKAKGVESFMCALGVR